MQVCEMEEIIAKVLERVQSKETDKIQSHTEGPIFATVNQAVKAAERAQQKLLGCSAGVKEKAIANIREMAETYAAELAQLTVRETGLGRAEDKVIKIQLAGRKTPGVEILQPHAYSGPYGLTLEEPAPYGVIGAITPSTNPAETVISNGIGMIAAGNAVVFNSHPGAKAVTRKIIELMNTCIIRAGGPPELLCGIENPNIETGKELMAHQGIRMLVVTGGPQIVKAALESGKKVIGAGPGNPPAVVDETADIKRAAADIVKGASFDNNILCIAEKEVFVTERAAKELIEEMVRAGAFPLSKGQLEQLMGDITCRDAQGNLIANKQYVGKNVDYILKQIGLVCERNETLAIAVVEKEHPLIFLEQLMPVLPIVIVKDVPEAIGLAYEAEQNFFHTAVMHSTNIDHLSAMAKRMNTSIFVKNAPSYTGLGMGGEGFATFTIASPTGEGLTCAADFTRQRRCVLKDGFQIV